MLTPFERGLVAHLIADWLLQNDWMAQNKNRLTHPAAWVHAGIHAVGLTLALGWQAGVVLGVLHMLIDTRKPLHWWQQFIKQRGSDATFTHVSIWADQVLHISAIAAWVVLME